MVRNGRGSRPPGYARPFLREGGGDLLPLVALYLQKYLAMVSSPLPLFYSRISSAHCLVFTASLES